ncbi:MAG: hypothetical protein HOE90_00265 [Bacteriovoracaceae bacterium]|jgi:hypothetical protein|nr:hypothetical protein [Bacteriovoracaceae bacterium]
MHRTLLTLLIASLLGASCMKQGSEIPSEAAHLFESKDAKKKKKKKKKKKAPKNIILPSGNFQFTDGQIALVSRGRFFHDDIPTFEHEQVFNLTRDKKDLEETVPMDFIYIKVDGGDPTMVIASTKDRKLHKEYQKYLVEDEDEEEEDDEETDPSVKIYATGRISFEFDEKAILSKIKIDNKGSKICSSFSLMSKLLTFFSSSKRFKVPKGVQVSFKHQKNSDCEFELE